MTRDEFQSEAVRRFGLDPMQWAFVCPACGHVATVQEWKDAGASEGEVAFSCIGRHIEGSRKAFGGNGPGPCDYAGGGLFRLNPMDVQGRATFAFAPTSARAAAKGGGDG